MNEQHIVCEFTPEGLQVARNYLHAIRTSGWMPLPSGLLSDHTYSQPVEPEVYVESRPFANRREAGQYLEERLEPLGTVRVAGNAYLWSWLGIFYLEQMVQDKTRRSGEYTERAYLVDPQSNATREYSHHRLMMAYDIWTQHREDAWFMLNEPVVSLGQFTLRLVSAPEVFRSEGVVPLAHTLYADKASGKLRARALGQTRAEASAGSLPRLVDVLNQLSLTYDVYGMTAEQLLDLLPPEFDRFKPLPAASR